MSSDPPKQLRKLIKLSSNSSTSSIQELMAQEQLKNIYEYNQDYAIFTIDPNGIIMTWNQGAVKMKQYTLQEILGQHFSILYPSESQSTGEPMANLSEALNHGSYRGKGIRVRKSGEHFLADVLITPMFRNDQLIGFSKIVSDISEQGKLQKEHQESLAKLKTLESQKDLREQFVSAMTHDLKNPLTAARSALELMSHQSYEQSTFQRLINITRDNLTRIDKMISNLLDANRIHSGHPLPLHFANCDLVEVAKEIVTELSMSHGNRIIIQANETVIGLWDKSELKRLIENLVMNALKYGYDSTLVTISIKSSGDSAFLSVHNFGPVIPPQDQKIIFQQFRRTLSSELSQKKGWGIGLTLVRGIAEAHGGSVRVESAPNLGTTFTVNLPKDVHQTVAHAS